MMQPITNNGKADNSMIEYQTKFCGTTNQGIS